MRPRSSVTTAPRGGCGWRRAPTGLSPWLPQTLRPISPDSSTGLNRVCWSGGRVSLSPRCYDDVEATCFPSPTRGEVAELHGCSNSRPPIYFRSHGTNLRRRGFNNTQNHKNLREAKTCVVSVLRYSLLCRFS